MKKNPILLVVIVALIVGAAAFYGGTMYASNKANNGDGANRRNFNGAGGFGRNPAGGAIGGGLVNGEILKQDATSITVKMRDGTSRIVFLSGTTQIQKSTDGTVADLSVGKQVMVMGKQNSDGTVTAEDVQIRPNILPLNLNRNGTAAGSNSN